MRLHGKGVTGKRNWKSGAKAVGKVLLKYQLKIEKLNFWFEKYLKHFFISVFHLTYTCDEEHSCKNVLSQTVFCNFFFLSLLLLFFFWKQNRTDSTDIAVLC